MKAWLWLFLSATAFAQDWQNRDTLHLMADIKGDCYLATWTIPNFRSSTPDNINFLIGVGCGDTAKWAEVMVQKQWNRDGGFWALDFRFYKQMSKNWSLYVEPTVVISKPGFYEFVIVERRLGSRVSLRGEAEGTFRLSKQSFAAGGGASFKLGEYKGWKFAVVAVYRSSPTGKDEPRAYLGISKRISLGGRK